MWQVKKFLVYTIASPVYLLSFALRRKKNLWIFSAWFGRKYGDNPRYLYEYASQKSGEVVVFWITKSTLEYKKLQQNGVNVVYCYSIKGIWLQLRAGTAICSHSISDEFIPWLINSKARKVNLWHGVPLKKVGRDVNFRQEGVIKKCIDFLYPYNYEDYFLFASTSRNTNKTYEYSFTVPTNRVKGFGYPRNDFLCKQKNAADASNRRCEKRSILYAPTYRNSALTAPLSVSDVQVINEICFKFNMHFDIKLHPIDFARLNADMVNASNVRLLDQSLDLNEILPNYDLLISDYSGVIVDFLLLDRPIILYVFDYIQFKQDQGLYSSFDIFLQYGEVASDQDVLFDYLVKFAKFELEFDNTELLEFYHDFTDSCASERYYRFLVNPL